MKVLYSSMDWKNPLLRSVLLEPDVAAHRRDRLRGVLVGAGVGARTLAQQIVDRLETRLDLHLRVVDLP